MKIRRLAGAEILNSRGEPVVTCIIELNSGDRFFASAPSGKSCGIHEALDIRDNDESRFNGKGALNSVDFINTVLNPYMQGKNPDFFLFDQELKNRLLLDDLGANATLACSIAMLRAQAFIAKQALCLFIAKILDEQVEQMPIPLFNVVNGGLHADNALFVQEMLLVPQKYAFSDAMSLGIMFYNELKGALCKRGFGAELGDESGFSPHIKNCDDPEKLMFDLLVKIVQNNDAYKNIEFGLDLAASSFYDQTTNTYLVYDKALTRHELTARYMSWVQHYPIRLLEDPFAQDDWVGWTEFRRTLKHRALLVGDDLTTTNPDRIKRAFEESSCDAVIIKPNQIGTVSDTFAAIRIAKECGFDIIVSHRSGETADTFIADLALGSQAQYFKAGPPVRERVVKYNRLLELGALLGLAF